MVIAGFVIGPEDPLLALLRGSLPELFLGPVFAFVGLCACSLAAIRRRREFRVLLWFGLFIGMYGVRILAEATRRIGLAPALWPFRLRLFVDYFLAVPGILFWVELTVGKLRRFSQWLAALGTAVGLFSLIWYVATGQPYRFSIIGNIIAIFLVFAMAVVIAIPSLSQVCSRAEPGFEVRASGSFGADDVLQCVMGLRSGPALLGRTHGVCRLACRARLYCGRASV
jgi:hypothetical protein